MNRVFAEVCGIHAGDGYLRNNGKRGELDISGSVEERGYYDQHVIPLFSKEFNISITGKFFPSRNTYGFVIREKRILERMHAQGFPYGKKSLTVHVPKRVFEKMAYKKSFLRGFFDTDGCLFYQKKTTGKYVALKKQRNYYPQIILSSVSKILIKEVKEMLEDLDFTLFHASYTSKKENENTTHVIHLNGIKNVQNWIDNVGTKNPTKYTRYLIWKKYGFCPPRTTYDDRLKILKGEICPQSYYGPVV